MIDLRTPPRLEVPTARVRTSFLVAEQADVLHRGGDGWWLSEASRDFDQYVAERAGVVWRWGVPSELFWFCSDEFYLGSLVIRHRLCPGDLGGHVGYHVTRPWRGLGHATRMLAAALPLCVERGIDRVLVTVAPENEASTRVARRNGGVRDGVNADGDVRWWIDARGTAG